MQSLAEVLTPHEVASALPMAFTHKKHADEVLLHAYRQLGENIVFDAAVPKAHAHYNSSPHGSRLLQAELLRQSTIAYAHLAHQVPFGWMFVMNGMRFEQRQTIRPGAIRVGAGASGVTAVRGYVRSLVSDVLLEQDGVVVGRGWGNLQVISPGVYERLRGRAAITQTPRGRASGKGVRISPVSSNEWRVHHDHNDRFYFDHEVDHVPGMVLFAGISLTVAATTGQGQTPLVDFDGRFARYVELEEELSICTRDIGVDSQGDREIEFTLLGSGNVACQALVRVKTDAPEVSPS